MEQQPVITPQTPDTGAAAPKKSKKTLLIILCIAALCIAGGTAGWMYYQQTHRAEQELADYEVLEGNYNTTDYEYFLENYPESELAPEVEQRLEQLRQMQAAWAALEGSGSKNDYVNFKNRYHDTRYDQLCDMKLDSLDWAEAQAIGTESAIQAYLTVHPEGRYAAEAAIAAGTVRNNQADEVEEEHIVATLTGFFTAFGENDDEAYCTYIAPVMTQFLSEKNATKADVVRTIGAMFNEHITACRFTLNDDYVVGKTTAADGTAQYTVDFSVDQRIERDNSGKTFGSYTAHATLSGQYKLTSLTLKEISRN